jgi:hypothetical protein
LRNGPAIGALSIHIIFMNGGVGRVTEERIKTFGTRGRVHIPRIPQQLFRYVTDPKRAVEHHTAFVMGEGQTIATSMKATPTN